MSLPISDFKLYGMKLVKKILKWFIYVLLIPITYLIVSLLFSTITIDRKDQSSEDEKLIYLNTNGVHLDVIIPKKEITFQLIKGLKHYPNEDYLSFGWGDENFYLNTPTWGDLTFSNAFSALFLDSSSLMHVTRYKEKRPNWVAIKVSKVELRALNQFLLNTFEHSTDGSKINIANKGYTANDDFYKAKGSYSCFTTCNSWVNTGFKESGLKSCLWTPFDFGLLNKYR